MNEFMTYGILAVVLQTLELLYFHFADRFNIIDKPNELTNWEGYRITCFEMQEDVWKKEFRKQKYQNNGQGPYIGAYQDKP